MNSPPLLLPPPLVINCDRVRTTAAAPLPPRSVKIRPLELVVECFLCFSLLFFDSVGKKIFPERPGSVLIFYFCKISVLILSFCMYLFCLFAHDTKATGRATYKSPLLTTSQNKYKCRQSTRGNSIDTATYVLYGTHSSVP